MLLLKRPRKEGTERAVRTSRAYVHLVFIFPRPAGNASSIRTGQDAYFAVGCYPGGPGGGSRGGGMGGVGIGLDPGGGSRGASLGGRGMRAIFNLRSTGTSRLFSGL